MFGKTQNYVDSIAYGIKHIQTFEARLQKFALCVESKYIDSQCCWSDREILARYRKNLSASLDLFEANESNRARGLQCFIPTAILVDVAQGDGERILL